MCPSWTERTIRGARAAALAGAAVALGACGGATRPEAAAVPVAPDPAAVAGYESALATLAAGDDAGAERQLAALAAAHPGYAGPLVNLGLIRARQGDLAGAAGWLERATAVCARCAPAWSELGVVQRRQGRFADAEDSYLRAIEVEEGYAPAWFNLGVLYDLYLQRPELALDRYQRFRELDPAATDVDKWIADLQRRTKSVERSAQLEPAS